MIGINDWTRIQKFKSVVVNAISESKAESFKKSRSRFSNSPLRNQSFGPNSNDMLPALGGKLLTVLTS